MVERIGVHLDLFVDVGGAVVGGEVAEGFEESLESSISANCASYITQFHLVPSPSHVIRPLILNLPFPQKVKQKKTYALHQITPLKLLILTPTHRHPAPQPAPLPTILHRPLLQRTILKRCASYGRFPRFVALEHVEEALLVRFCRIFDFGEGRVGGPEGGVAPVRVEGLGRDGGCGC